MNITEARSLIANTASVRVEHITCTTLDTPQATWRPSGNIWVASRVIAEIGGFLGEADLIKVADVIHEENEAFLAFLCGAAT